MHTERSAWQASELVHEHIGGTIFCFSQIIQKNSTLNLNRSNHFSGLRKYCHGFSHANKSFVEYLIRCLLIVFVAVCPGGGVRRRTIIKLSSPATRKLTQRQRGLGRAAIGLWLGRRQSALSRNGRSASKSQVAVTIVPWTTTATLVAQMSKRGSLLRRLAVPIAPITTQATSATPRIWMATRAIMAMRAGFRWAIRGCSASVARKKLNATMVTPTSWPSSRRSSSPARIHTGPSRLVFGGKFLANFLFHGKILTFRSGARLTTGLATHISGSTRAPPATPF